MEEELRGTKDNNEVAEPVIAESGNNESAECVSLRAENLDVSTEEGMAVQEAFGEEMSMDSQTHPCEAIHGEALEEMTMEQQSYISELTKEEQAVRTDVWQHDANSPYSPLYVPDKKQSGNNKITICFVVILLVALVGGMIAAVSILVESAMKEVSVGTESWKSAWEEFADNFGDKKIPEEDFFDEWKEQEGYPVPEFDFSDGFTYPEERYEDYFEDYFGDEYDFYDDYGEYDEYDEYDEYGENDIESYVPSENDEYYATLADAIRDDLSYTVEKEVYKYSDNSAAVDILVEYVTVEGAQLAFEDKINEALEAGAMYYAKEFGAGDYTGIMLVVSSYVTYMDENTLSVVVDERYSYGSNISVDLYCMNFDLRTGTVQYNTDIINPTEDLAKAFLEMSEYQNGYVEFLDGMSPEEVCVYFEDEESLILFYTPVGLEIGFNYFDGWVTATLKEYEEYLTKL